MRFTRLKAYVGVHLSCMGSTHEMIHVWCELTGECSLCRAEMENSLESLDPAMPEARYFSSIMCLSLSFAQSNLNWISVT